MNESLRNYAKDKIKRGLSELPEGWQRTFKLMYGRKGGKRSVEDCLAMDINKIVDELEDTKIDWAMTQIDNSFKSIAKKENER